MISIKDISLLDIMPENLLADKNVLNAAKAIDEQTQDIAEKIKYAILLARSDELDGKLLDLLAWQWHADFYEASMDLATKLKLVKKSIAWHRRKGTKAAVEEAVNAVFGEAHVLEWFEYGGEPYHFKIDLLDADGITQNKYDTIIRLVETVKNTRSVLEGFDIRKTVSLSDESSIKYGQVLWLNGYRRTHIKTPENTSLSIGYGFGDFSHGRQIINCGPAYLSDNHIIRLGIARALNGVIRVECDTSEIPEEFRNILMPSVSGPYIGSGTFSHGYKRVGLQLPDDVSVEISGGSILCQIGTRVTGLGVPEDADNAAAYGTHSLRLGRIRVPADTSEITMGGFRSAHAGIAHAGISQAGL